MKIPFIIEKTFNKIFKPQIVTIVETFIDDIPQKKFYGKSLTANYLQFLYAHFAQNSANFVNSGAPFSSKNTATTTSNTQVSCQSVTENLNAALGDATKGIAVGSGTGAPAPGDYVLGTLIANGSGANQLNYQAQTSIQGAVISGANTSFILERLFTNNSGGSITVNEIGMFVNNAGQWLIYRDLVSPGDTIPNGSSYKVNITFQITT